MGKYRKLPYGYRMDFGKVVIEPDESKWVIYIFEQYIRGESFKGISDTLKDAGISYDADKSWNKNMVARILQDRRYTGEGKFPHIIDTCIFQMVDQKRSQKATDIQLTKAQKMLKKKCGYQVTPHLEYEVLYLLNTLAGKGKIDLILTKSISRFARNTLDTIKYTRMLRTMGIGIYFEKENINTLDMDSEMLITMLGAFAQAESESISRNVAWGKRKAIQSGKVFVNFNQLYGYYLREDRSPGIDLDKAAVVKFIYQHYLYGDSLRMIKERLDNEGILNPKGEPGWLISSIKSILTNEKYCGDVLGQKTYKESVIGGKVMKNNGQLPQVLVQNNHPAIISREMFYAVQEEMKRRTAARSPSTKSATGRTSYASKYALSERLVCGECGTLYRRCTWTIRGNKKIVWRCVSRLDHGTKYCKTSPSMEETTLQKAIMDAINRSMDTDGDIVRNVAVGFLAVLKPQENAEFTLGEVKRRIQELNAEFDTLFAMDGSEVTHKDRFSEIALELAELKKRQETISAQLRNNQGIQAKVNRFANAAERMDHKLTQWDEELIRQLIHTVEVISKDRIRVVLTDGTEVEQQLHTQ